MHRVARAQAKLERIFKQVFKCIQNFMFKAKESRFFALLLAFFFASTAQANSDAISQRPIAADQSQNPNANDTALKPPEPTLLPNAGAAPANAVVETPKKPAVTNIDTPLVRMPIASETIASETIASEPNAGKPIANKPIASNSGSALTDLPASNRLVISILAGALTLVAALWIGARRD